MKTQLVIKGAHYFDGESILIPHFTGQFFTVDCTEYTTKQRIKDQYDKNFIKEHKSDFIEYEGVKYYFAEYSPFNITQDWELLSDLSELEHSEENYY
jgi:hypothetical protein